MKRLLVFLAVGILLLGCAQQAPGTPNASGPNITAPNLTLPNISAEGGGTANVTGNGSGGENATGNETQNQPPEGSAFAHYDLSIKEVSLNTSTPTLSYYSTLSVKVGYEGKSKPSRYKVSYYDGTTLAESKTVNSPQPDETVNFYWLALQDGTHNIKAAVETFADEPLNEDGPADNNQMERQFELLPIQITESDAGKEVSAQMYRAQQFSVSNKIGIGSISIYLKADQKPDDVQLVVELRKDDFNKPGNAIKSSRISARDIGAPHWYSFSYGTNGVFLTADEYWIVAYLEEESGASPVWLGTGDVYAGKSAALNKSQGYGNIWNLDQGDFAFKVSAIPQ